MPSLPKDTDRVFSEFLRDNKIIDAAKFDKAVMEDKASNEGVINSLLKTGATSEEIIADGIAKFYNLKRANVTPEMIAGRPFKDKISESFVQKNRVIPFGSNATSVSVVIADPAALGNVNNVKFLVGKPVETFVTTLSSMEKIILSLAGEVPAEKKTAEEQKNPLQPKKPGAGAGLGGRPMPKTKTHEKASDTGSDVVDFVNSVLQHAITMGVSDIHIESYRDSSRVRFRKDGVLQEPDEYGEFLHYNYSAIVTRIKIMSQLDISERRLPQDGAISSNITDRMVDIRVSILPTNHGERVVMRILDPKAADMTLDELGMPKEILGKLERAIYAPQGMILVTGPTGSGKSTTLYAILKALNQVKVNVLTAEDPVEYDLGGVGQVHVREDIGLGFTAALRSFLRQDPEIIMVGEIRDKETIDIAMKAALTGHLVLSTIHTNDAPSTITRLINMGVPPYLITSALTLVVAQRLARVICPVCKIEDEAATPERLKSIGFTDKEIKELKFFKGKGCEKCYGTGVKGRRAVHEVLQITPNVKKAIIESKSDVEIREIALKDNFKTMQEIGRFLMAQGVMSVEEYQRILTYE